MENHLRTIQILPHDRQIKTLSGQTLLEALKNQSIFLRSDCGGKGKCGKCLVEKISNEAPPKLIESCMYEVTEDISIRIPETSLLSSNIMSKAIVSLPDAFNAMFKNHNKKSVYGFAVDLGTTTIGIYLCNTTKGEVISSIAVKNPQSIYGDDVMSRIGVIVQNAKNLDKLQEMVVKSIEYGIQELLFGLDSENFTFSEMVVVGNPVMIHILAGIDPKSIGIFPYKPAFYETKIFQAANLGFSKIDVSIRTLPQLSGFIGGDIIAAAVAVDLEKQPEGTLLLDLGTNGELMLKVKNKLYATSCATGPAFEGATLSCGMQAIPGAIKTVEINSNHHIERLSTITSKNRDKTKPIGICGAGVINAIAQFRMKKIIDHGGAFTSGGDKFILAYEDSAINQPSVYISQKDIRCVQLGKAALVTGIEFLLNKAGLEKPEKIIIAGAFGSHLNVPDMLRIGMIPIMDINKIESSGNSAGSGAIMVLCSQRYFEKALHIADKTKNIELASSIDFQESFIKNLAFPKNDADA